MFGKHLRLKRFLGGIVVTAAVAAVAASSAFSSTSTRGGGSAPATQPQGYRFVTDTLGGARHPVQAGVPGYDTSAYVPGGATAGVAKAIQDFGYGRTAGPVVTGGSSGTGINWGDAGIVALAALLLLLVLGGMRLRTNKPNVSTA